MASPRTLDLDQLTAPISDDFPAGSYLRETDYSRLMGTKDKRTAAIASERKLRDLSYYSEEDLELIPEEDRQLSSPNWRPIKEECVEILSSHSKDLWVAAWLIEASVRMDGYAGLRDCFTLVSELVEKYWDNINPPPDEEEGYRDTVSHLTSLNGRDGQGTLVSAIEDLSLIPGSPEFTFTAYREAVKADSPEITESEFLAAAQSVANVDDYKCLAEDIHECINAFAAMNASLADRCGSYDGVPLAPPRSQIQSALEECLRIMLLIAGDRLADADVDATLSDDGAGETFDGQLIQEGGRVNQSQAFTREDAFRSLLQAAEFFRNTEPHSPVSYMLQQAVRFGRMDLPHLLQELIPDSEVLQRFAERTGIELNDISRHEGDD